METNDRMCDKSLELFNEELTDKGKIYEIIDSLDVQNGRDMTIKEYLEAIGNNKDNNRLLCDVYKDRLLCDAHKYRLLHIRSLSDLDTVTTNVQRLSVRDIIEIFDNK